MMTIALLLALLSAPQEDAFPGLLQKLESDSVEVRDRATADLLGLGEAARVRIESALRDATNAEVHARLRSVIRRLDLAKRRKEFAGCKIVDDLGARLTISHDSMAKRLTIAVEVTNLGLVDRSLVEIKHWNVKLPHESHRYSGAEGEIRVEQLTGLIHTGSYLTGIGCGPTPARKTVLLIPGQSTIFKHTLDIAVLTPGNHRVTVAGLRGVLGTSEDLVSDEALFQVEK